MRARARHRRPGSALGALLLAWGLAGSASPAWAAGGAGGGGGGGGYAPGRSGSSREQEAQEKFEAGERHRERGTLLESRAAETSDPAAAARLRDDARSEFEAALREYQRAVRSNRDFVRAHNGVGFTRRKLGDYEGALEAYDRALKLDPRFAPAIEYRGEAYLELGRLDDVKGAYMQLFAGQRELADLLMGKMQAWVERRRRDPGSLAPSQIEDFARWVGERAEIAGQTARVPAQGGASW